MSIIQVFGVLFHSAAKKQIYFSFLYLGFQSNCIKRPISALNKFYPQLNINVISTNHHTIGSYFKFKDVILNSLASSVIYCLKNYHSQNYFLQEFFIRKINSAFS